MYEINIYEKKGKKIKNILYIIKQMIIGEFSL